MLRHDYTRDHIVVCIADLVLDQVARAHVAWPWGDTGGFMTLDSSMSSRSGPTEVAKE